MAEPVTPPQSETVVLGKSTWQELWTKEDYWAIWLGFLVLIVGMFIFFNNPPAQMEEKFKKANDTLAAEAKKAPFKTIAWHQASSAKSRIRATNEDYAKSIAGLFVRPHAWSGNPIDAFYMSDADAKVKADAAKPAADKAKADAEAALAKAKESEKAAETAGFKDAALNAKAEGDITAWVKANAKSSSAARKAGAKGYNLFPSIIGLGVVLCLFFSIGAPFIGIKWLSFVKGFWVVYLFAILAYTLERQDTMNYYGFGYPLWAIILGMLVSNTVGTPKWVLEAARTEYFIKTGLVLLGAEILMGKILAIGTPGLFVAWICTPTVLIATYWFGQRVLKIPSKTLNITISADMSVSGVSAAIATAAACRAKKEELTLAIGISMVFTAVMMVAMPAFVKAVGMNHILAGAWLGGTIDSTGAVAAAGAFLSEKALWVAATVKMIQNVLIGLTAFGVAVYWCAKVDCVAGQKVSWMEVWYRFPKFVLGFLAASIVFSIIDSSMGSDVSAAVVDHGVLRGFSRLLREWFFCLAFAAIGLETNFREVSHYFKGGKPVTLYVVGQSLQLALSLAMAYVMFFLVFPEITAKI